MSGDLTMRAAVLHTPGSPPSYAEHPAPVGRAPGRRWSG